MMLLICRKEAGGFIGDEIIIPELDVKPPKLPKRRVGLKIDGRAPIRQGANILSNDEVVGVVTSGTLSPSLKIPIAMGYVKGPLGKPNTVLQVEVRNPKGKVIRTVDATVSKMPFLDTNYKK